MPSPRAGSPRTSDELKAAGYKFDGHARCSTCGTAIEWYLTPYGRKLPLLHMPRGSDAVEPHWSHSCQTPALFR